MTVPDLMMDFSEGGGRLIHRTVRAARVRRSELLGAHFSPCCKKRTILNRLEATQGEDRGQGANAGKEEDTEEVRTVEEMVTGILRWERE